MQAAAKIDLAMYVDGLCTAWLYEDFIGPVAEARQGMGAYEVQEGAYFVLQGDGTVDHPFLVVLQSMDIRVEAVCAKNGSFQRFQIPQAGSLSAKRGTYALAGPSHIGHRMQAENAKYRVCRVGQQFIDGKLGGDAPKYVPFRIDTDHVGGWNRLRKILVSSGQVGRGHRADLEKRVIWSFLHPNPQTSGLDKHIENKHGALLDDRGRLAEGSTPAQRIDWQLEVEVMGQPFTVWRLVFSREYDAAVARARAAVAGSLSLGKGTFAPGGRGAARVQVLTAHGW
ncbi:hypothetical protein JCM10449v2_004093 [Rhodotorula kratochvilovae]